MKKYIPLHADISDLKQAMRDVLREEKVLTQKDRETIPTIKEIEKTLEMYPTKEDLKRELHSALASYPTKDDLKHELGSMEKRMDTKYASKDDLTKAIEPIVVQMKKIRAEIIVSLGLKNQKITLPD